MTPTPTRRAFFGMFAAAPLAVIPAAAPVDSRTVEQRTVEVMSLAMRGGLTLNELRREVGLDPLS